LKSSNPLVGEILHSLPKKLEVHNSLAQKTQLAMLTKLNDGLADHKLEYDRSGQATWNILRLLSDVWHQYITSFKMFDKSRLLDYLRRTFPRNDDGHLLYLGTYAVWDERQEGERDKVIEIIDGLLTDSEILIDLGALEDSKGKLEVAISEIAKEANRLSNAIDADAYTGKSECCYALVPRWIRFLVR
jgi:hypothetical protein